MIIIIGPKIIPVFETIYGIVKIPAPSVDAIRPKMEPAKLPG